MAGEIILVVDDNEVNLKLLRVILSGGGYEVRTATNAKDAMAIIRTVHPPVVLMDVQLPDVDGLEVTRRLKAVPETRDIRVLAVTAYAMKGDEEKARAAGCDGYLSKPIDTRTLLSVVEGVLHKSNTPVVAAPLPIPTELEADAAPDRTPELREDLPVVLVVEDNPQMRRFLVATLSREYNVVAASDGQEGLEKARLFDPDLILTDMMMPRMNGDELVAALRADDAFNGTPIVVLTGQSEDELRIKLLRSGAQDYLIKPCSPDEIDVRIRSHMRMKRVRDVLQKELETRREDVESLAYDLTRKTRELRTALDEVQVAREQAEQASRVKTHFLQLMSHELRTPLTSLELAVRQLERGTRDSPPTDLIKRIDRSSQRLRELVDSLLEFARMQSARITLNVGHIDLVALCQDVLDEVRPYAEEKHLVLRHQWPKNSLPIESDERLVRLVLINILLNAIKFTETGTVELTVEPSDTGHLIRIRDTGVGIAPADQNKIFQPFFHLEPLSGKHIPGAGLGLSLVRQTLEILGGQVSVDSKPGFGSAFTVSLPSTQKSTHSATMAL